MSNFWSRGAEFVEIVKEAAQHHPQAAAAMEAATDTVQTIQESDAWKKVVENAQAVRETNAWQTVKETVEKHPKTTAVAVAVTATVIALYPEIVVKPILGAAGFGLLGPGPTGGTIASTLLAPCDGFFPAGSRFSLSHKAAMGGGGLIMGAVSSASALTAAGSIVYLCIQLQNDKKKAIANGPGNHLKRWQQHADSIYSTLGVGGKYQSPW